MPNPSIVPITQPRVPFLNPETGFVSTPWYLFLLSLSQLTGGSDVSLGDLQKGPPTLTVDEINALIDKASAALDPSQDGLLAQLAELQKQVESLAIAPSFVVAGQSLTEVDDTNVTLTLGGNPAVALLEPVSLTLGWNGQLGVSRGGTGVSATPTNGQLLIGNGTGYAVANLTAGTNISITNTAGGISIASSNPGGTVTSVATGTGLTGGPITTTGTISFSTAAVGTWAATPSSANLAAAVTDETGSGSLVFATRPSFASTVGVGGATASASGAGVSFPVTQSASTDPNTLDDYEEGTWTPGYAPTTGAFTTITYGFASGYYRKIGDIVFCTCRLRTSAFVVGTGSGIVLLTGLPFTTFSATASNAATPAAISVSWVVNPSGIVTVASSTTAQIQKTFSNTGTVVADMSAGAANNFLSLTFFYVAA